MGFGSGGQITVTCVNKATVPLGVNFDALIKALQTQVTRDFGPSWGINAVVQAGKTVAKGTWGMIFTDTADVANALGYHDLTNGGLPQGHVFVKTTIDDHELVSVTASHELMEMLVDPAIATCVQADDNDARADFYAYEVCDPCEQETYNIGSVAVSDFVYPAWFEGFRAPKSTKFDRMGLITKPFQILSGGYMPIYKNGQWDQIFGSKAAEKRFNPARKHRGAGRTCDLKK